MNHSFTLGSGLSDDVSGSSMSSSSSVDSSLTSSVSQTVWSTPRARSNSAMNRSGGLRLGGPRRAGTSFRVSLRPSSYQKRHDNKAILEEPRSVRDRFHDYLSTIIQTSTSIQNIPKMLASEKIKRILVALTLMCLLGTVISFLPTTRHHYVRKNHAVANLGHHAATNSESSKSFSNIYDTTPTLKTNEDQKVSVSMIPPKLADTANPSGNTKSGDQAVQRSSAAASVARADTTVQTRPAGRAPESSMGGETPETLPVTQKGTNPQGPETANATVPAAFPRHNEVGRKLPEENINFEAAEKGATVSAGKDDTLQKRQEAISQGSRETAS